MRTTYLTQLTTAFNPFSLTSRVPRLFLGHLPPNAHKLIQIKCTTLPQASTAPAFLELAFKDGQRMRYEWSEQDVQKPKPGSVDASNSKKRKVTTLQNIIFEVDRHARMAQRKEELNG
ncbi:hypothetical protein DV735_g2987, partial [Chaetothyriales sp. CBS 134920]